MWSATFLYNLNLGCNISRVRFSQGLLRVAVDNFRLWGHFSQGAKQLVLTITWYHKCNNDYTIILHKQSQHSEKV